MYLRALLFTLQILDIDMKAKIKGTEKIIHVRSLFDANGVWTGSYIGIEHPIEYSKYELDFNISDEIINSPKEKNNGN